MMLVKRICREGSRSPEMPLRDSHRHQDSPLRGQLRFTRRKALGEREPKDQGEREPVAASSTHARRRRHAALPPQDTAWYSCQCGLLFEAPVSTSVRCPHCGAAQAW